MDTFFHLIACVLGFANLIEVSFMWFLRLSMERAKPKPVLSWPLCFLGIFAAIGCSYMIWDICKANFAWYDWVAFVGMTLATFDCVWMLLEHIKRGRVQDK